MEKEISGKSKVGKTETKNGAKAKISKSQQDKHGATIPEIEMTVGKEIKVGEKTKNGRKTKNGKEVDTRATDQQVQLDRAMNREIESKAIQKYANQQRSSQCQPVLQFSKDRHIPLKVTEK